MRKRELKFNKKCVTTVDMEGPKKEVGFKDVLKIVESSKYELLYDLKTWFINTYLSLIIVCLIILIVVPKIDPIQVIVFGSNLFIGLTAIIISINPYKKQRKKYEDLIEILLKFKIIYKLLEYDLIVPKEQMIGNEKAESTNYYLLRKKDAYLFENNSKNFYKLGYRISEIEPFFWNVLNLRIDNQFIGNFMWRDEISFSNDEWRMNVYNSESKIDGKSGGLSIYSKKLNKLFDYRNPIKHIEVKEEFLKYYLNHVFKYTAEYLKDYLKDKRYYQLLELLGNNPFLFYINLKEE